MGILKLDSFLSSFIKTRIADKNKDGKLSEEEASLFKYSDAGKDLSDKLEFTTKDEETNQTSYKAINWNDVNEVLRINDFSEKATDLAMATSQMMFNIDTDKDGSILDEIQALDKNKDGILSAEEIAEADDIDDNLNNIFAIYGDSIDVSDNSNLFKFENMQRYAGLVNIENTANNDAYTITENEANQFGSLLLGENVDIGRTIETTAFLNAVNTYIRTGADTDDIVNLFKGNFADLSENTVGSLNYIKAIPEYSNAQNVKYKNDGTVDTFKIGSVTYQVVVMGNNTLIANESAKDDTGQYTETIKVYNSDKELTETVTEHWLKVEDENDAISYTEIQKEDNIIEVYERNTYKELVEDIDLEPAYNLISVGDKTYKIMGNLSNDVKEKVRKALASENNGLFSDNLGFINVIDNGDESITLSNGTNGSTMYETNAPIPQSTTFTFDEEGNVKDYTVSGYINGTKNTFKTKYDKNGTKTEVQYDKDGNITSVNGDEYSINKRIDNKVLILEKIIPRDGDNDYEYYIFFTQSFSFERINHHTLDADMTFNIKVDNHDIEYFEFRTTNSGYGPDGEDVSYYTLDGQRYEPYYS